MDQRPAIGKATAAALAGTIVLLLSGCAGMGVVATDDPAGKLADASALIRYDRPLPAERLIREAIEIYEKRNDPLGLAQAYSAYGLFFASTSVEASWSKLYRDRGFLDRTASFESRLERSVEYFEKAAALFAHQAKFGALANVQVNIGLTHERRADYRAACLAYERSLESHSRGVHSNVNATIVDPRGQRDFESDVAGLQRRAGCGTRANGAAATRLNATLLEKVIAALYGYKATAPLVETLSIHTVDRGRFYGEPVVHEKRSRYVLHSDGLLDITTRISGPRGGTAHTLSMCGLVDLRLSEQVVSAYSGRRDIYDRTVTDFETTLKNLCAPLPGDEFSLRIEFEQKHSSNSYLGNPPPRMTMASAMSCKMAADYRPAAELLSGAHGEALLAWCERTTKTGEQTLVEYAFLKQSSIYVLLKEAAPRHTVNVEYRNARYQESPD